MPVRPNIRYSVSTYLSGENLGHSFHDKWLFRNVTLGINKGRRVALVGINGAGKSTLLKILSGKLPPTEGKSVRSKDLRISYLDQDPRFDSDSTISDFIFSADNLQQQLIRQYEELLDTDPTNEAAINKISEELSMADAWSYEYEIKQILGRLDIHHLQQKIGTLSGGQRKRLALAGMLIQDPDVYVLDEPTNHLDIDTIEWLEKLLTDGGKTIIMVTHDRYFLDNVCDEIIEIDNGKLYPYHGNYQYYLEKKAERDATDAAQFQKNTQLLKKELEWMRRQPQARGTKSKARIDSFYELEEKTKIDKKEKVQLSIKTARQGNKILELNNVGKSFNGKHVFNNFNYVFKKGDRIGIAGKNGSGKSTLLNIITKNINPDSGSVDKGETTVIGYFNQVGISFSEEDRVIDIVKSVAEFITMADGKMITASQLLTQFLFLPNKQYGLVANLSGGEKKRLQLMRILMQNPNFLILDEPTNDLDIDTLNVLEEFLLNYTGVLLLVSHDRYLLDKLVDQLFILTNDEQITIYNGNYSSYRLEIEGENKIDKKQKLDSDTLAPIEQNKAKLSFKELKELETIEKEIAEFERQIASLTKTLNSGIADHVKLSKLSQEIQTLSYVMDEKSMRWLELSEKQS